MAGIVVNWGDIRGAWGKQTQDYDTAHDASSGNWTGPEGSPIGQQHMGSGWYQLHRGMADWDLSEISPLLTIASAKIVVPAGTSECTVDNDLFAVLVDATGVTAGDSGYGEMLYKTTGLGSLYIPVGYHEYTLHEIIFNSAGLSFLESKAGGLARIGLRMSDDIADDEPSNETNRLHINKFYPNPGQNVPYMVINYLPTTGGYIWVEGNNLAYIDNNLDKRVKTGTLEGATGKLAGTHWLEGTKQRYIDSSGNERYIEGTLTGLTGKIPGQLSINTKSPMLGTHYCYIDSSGNERCFEGTA